MGRYLVLKNDFPYSILSAHKSEISADTKNM